MSERYSKLFALSENLYSSGAPVIIAAGALQKDNQTGKVFAQLKTRSIQEKMIKAATVRLTPLDTVGKPLGEAFEYQYLDLSAERDADFGQRTLIPFKDTATRSFSVSVQEVVFSDNSVWTASNEAWEPLPSPVEPETALSDSELVKQYRIKYGTDCKCIFKKEKDLWRCACGAINHDSEKNCHSCHKEAAELAALDVDELKADRDKRLEAEQEKAAEEKAATEKKAAEEKAAAEARAKKTKKIAMIAAPIVVVVIVAAVLFSNASKKQAAYNDALALVEAGKYNEAVAAFTELGNYKDSAEQINETLYVQALDLFEAEKYDRAINVFTKLGDYKDSAEQLKKVSFKKGMTESIAKTYEQLQASTYDSEYIQELKAICETYIPYCGNFISTDSNFVDVDLQFSLSSDFYLHDNEVCWKVKMPKDNELSLHIDSYRYSFFVDTPADVLIVSSSMKVTDEWKTFKWKYDCIGIATFKDGKICIEISDDEYIYYDVTYEKVS